jgi:hypothetical protein
MSVRDEVAELDWDGEVLRHDGMLWRPKSDSRITVFEFVRARVLFLELHRDARWNPWVLDDHAAELAQAIDAMDQWERAEPGFKRLTLEDLEARWVRSDEEHRTRLKEEEQVRERRRAHHDPARSNARLALIEREVHLALAKRDADELRDGSRFRATSPDRRTSKLAELDTSADAIEVEVEDLRRAVGDPETAIDAGGWLPADRRAMSLTLFRVRREREVGELREAIAALNSELGGTRDRQERARLRNEIRSKTDRRDRLVAIPPRSEDDMCAECVRPVEWHRTGRLGLLGEGPCPAWPRWAARIAEARRLILSAAERKSEPSAVPPKPAPLAVVPSGVPIAEVVGRLTAISEEHPDAVIRRGRANKWEIWAAD